MNERIPCALMPGPPPRREDVSRAIVRNVTARLKALDMSQKELAEAIGVASSTLNNWLNGTAMPASILAIIAHVLRCSMDWLSSTSPETWLVDQWRIDQRLVSTDPQGPVWRGPHGFRVHSETRVVHDYQELQDIDRQLGRRLDEIT